ncbi:hypothetical protein F2Q70_00016505 [Brassica cretica]|uniref:Uncharacterized protein n=1 Tax=Brassica cretica TaxID=69181 RepID=A0A8S9I353_BRACR|nr:hypothetical protein F2Q70_00016505 [Brassica cretica]
MTGTQLLDELAQAVRSLVQLYQLNYVRLDPRKGPPELGNSLTAFAAKAFMISCNDRNALTQTRNKCEFRFPQFGARMSGGGYGLLLLMATKRLIETMSGYMKDKLAALTAPMVTTPQTPQFLRKSKTLLRLFAARSSMKRARDFSF